MKLSQEWSRDQLHFHHRRHLAVRRDGPRPDHGGDIGSRGAKPPCQCLDLHRPHRRGTAAHSPTGGWPWHLPRIQRNSSRNRVGRRPAVAIDGHATLGEPAKTGKWVGGLGGTPSFLDRNRLKWGKSLFHPLVGDRWPDADEPG